MRYILKGGNKGIFFEFMLQEKRSDAIILLSGFPSNNCYDEIITYFYENGFHVFFPRYKGMYQSDGNFLEENIIYEVSRFVDYIKKGKVGDLWSEKQISYEIENIFILASSFSGAIACGVAAQNKIDKLVLFSPVWDFNEHNKNGNEQDLLQLTSFVRRAYKHCYRFKFKDVTKKMKDIKELSKDYYLHRLRIPILVFHDPDDNSVSINHTMEIKKKLNFRLVTSNFGHGINNILRKNKKMILDFLRN